MKFQWEPKFETGIKTIDLQHEYFVELISRIHDIIKDSTYAAYKHKLIIELKKYTDFHFTSEENIGTLLSVIVISNY